jgi:hypothetical protein
MEISNPPVYSLFKKKFRARTSNGFWYLLANTTQLRVIFNISCIISRITNTWEAEAEMPEKTRTASGPLPGSPEVADISQENSSIPEKINLSIDEDRRRLQEEHQLLLEETRQKEDELKELVDESINTLNDAFNVLRSFSDVIAADHFIEDSRRRIDQARPDERTHVIRDVLRSTSTLMDIMGSRRRGQ